MIVPAGRQKDQVAQGPFKNMSIFESSLFSKLGQGTSGLVDDPKKEKPGNMQGNGEMQGNEPSDLQSAMGDSQSRLNMNDNIPGADSGQQSQQTQQGSPASRFLGPDPDAQQQQGDPNQIWQAERQKIRSFIGNDFGMRLTQGNDGTFSVAIKPPGNMPVQNPTGFMDALLQYIGGASVTEEDTPAISDTGGALMLKYRPSGAGPEKIRPRGKGRK